MKRIDCPWCGARIDNRIGKLAEHIFKAHSDDVELCAWARAELEKTGKIVKQSVSKKLADAIQMYRGKPVDRIPPARQ